MANDRIYIRCTCGKSLMLMKYYPGGMLESYAWKPFLGRSQNGWRSILGVILIMVNHT